MEDRAVKCFGKNDGTVNLNSSFREIGWNLSVEESVTNLLTD